MHTMTESILKQREAVAFDNGVKYALEYLYEVYGEGIEETDLWAEYMNEEAK